MTSHFFPRDNAENENKESGDVERKYMRRSTREDEMEDTNLISTHIVYHKLNGNNRERCSEQ